MANVQVVFSADDAYFPLAKGLVLSILHAGPPPPSCELAFIDLGCSPDRLSTWPEHCHNAFEVKAPGLSEQVEGFFRFSGDSSGRR